MEKLLELEETKIYCRIDYDDDDLLIEDLIAYSEGYLKNAVDGFDLKKENETFRNQVKLAMLRIVKNEYDNRDPMETRIGEKTSFYMRSTIQQLNNAYGASL